MVKRTNSKASNYCFYVRWLKVYTRFVEPQIGLAIHFIMGKKHSFPCYRKGKSKTDGTFEQHIKYLRQKERNKKNHK